MKFIPQKKAHIAFALISLNLKVGRKIPPPVFTGRIYRYFPAWQIRFKWQILTNNGKYNFLPRNTGKYEF